MGWNTSERYPVAAALSTPRDLYYSRPMPMTAWNVTDIANLLLEAGRMALTYYEDRSPTLKSDRSIVTEADKAIERRLGEYFDAPEQGIYMIGEETNEERGEEYVQQAMSGTTWVVDPIDGTAPYTHHLPSWGVSIGLMQDRRLTEGGIFLPATGELAITDGDRVLFGRLGCDPAAWDPSHLEPLIYEALGNPGRGVVSLAQGVVKHARFSGDYLVHAVGSCVFSVIGLVTASMIGYVASIKLWDIAAGVAMFRKLGFVMKFEDGERFDGRVDERGFLLDPDEPARWKMRTHLYVAVDEATCDDLIRSVAW
jgi:fructose-1,6-bisphosphatase/inositol monophosphatase family enzyme